MQSIEENLIIITVLRTTLVTSYDGDDPKSGNVSSNHREDENTHVECEEEDVVDQPQHIHSQTHHTHQTSQTLLFLIHNSSEKNLHSVSKNSGNRREEEKGDEKKRWKKEQQKSSRRQISRRRNKKRRSKREEKGKEVKDKRKESERKGSYCGFLTGKSIWRRKVRKNGPANELRSKFSLPFSFGKLFTIIRCVKFNDDAIERVANANTAERSANEEILKTHHKRDNKVSS